MENAQRQHSSAFWECLLLGAARVVTATPARGSLLNCCRPHSAAHLVRHCDGGRKEQPSALPNLRAVAAVAANRHRSPHRTR